MKIYFHPGQVSATHGAHDLMEKTSTSPRDLLIRHLGLEQGDLCDVDHQTNKDALTNGGRILSSFLVKSEKIWVITEADRSVTTLLLPSEY